MACSESFFSLGPCFTVFLGKYKPLTFEWRWIISRGRGLAKGGHLVLSDLELSGSGMSGSPFSHGRYNFCILELSLGRGNGWNTFPIIVVHSPVLVCLFIHLLLHSLERSGSMWQSTIVNSWSVALLGLSLLIVLFVEV